MNYAELKEEAKALGINPVGIKKEILAEMIEEAKGSEPQTEETTNAAIVYNGTSEVRRYTIQEHGEAFGDLAVEFSQKHKYTVKLVTLE